MIRQAKQYLPISLRTLQRLIDLRRVNPAKPIDLPVLCNTKLFSIQPDQRQFGLQLTDEVKSYRILSKTSQSNFFIRVLISSLHQSIWKFNGLLVN